MNQESPLPVTVDKLDLILNKLNSIEHRLDKLESLTQPLPGIVATASDTLDIYFQHLDPDSERLVPEVKHILQSLMQPEILAGFNQMLTLIPTVAPHLATLESLPGILATASDSLEEGVAYLESRGVDVPGILPELMPLIAALLSPKTLHALLHFVTSLPELTPMLLLTKDLPGMLATVTDVVDDISARLLTSEDRIEAVMSQAVQAFVTVQKGQKEAPALGPIGVLKAMGDADIQRLIGFLVYVSKHVSQDILKK